ncbi:MAG: 50S ribosomal protein L11 methyltransferase, partial [Cetobacterium sp.]
EPEENELVIELDPGRAFGTGSHPTTSLCLKIMEENIKAGNSVIDVGTGSGILMIAAEKLGATDIYGTDIDELAVEATKENLELNNISSETSKVFLGDLISVVKDKQFDVVVANILADVILLLLKDIFKVVKKDGLIIFSGIIEDKLPEIVKQVEEKGLEILEIKRDKEWRALLIKA